MNSMKGMGTPKIAGNGRSSSGKIAQDDRTESCMSQTPVPPREGNLKFTQSATIPEGGGATVRRRPPNDT